MNGRSWGLTQQSKQATPLRLRNQHFGVDAFELRVAVGMAGAFIRLPVGLPREADFAEQFAPVAGADLVAHCGKPGGELVETL